jgi:ubiquinone/menaquinone biosynthesis C-methylase UbiE
MNTQVPGGQAGYPSGLIGKVFGLIMRWHNQPDNEWTISLLNLQPSDRVLEIGFGPGQAIEYAARIATSGFVTGVDHSETMVQEASKRNAKRIQSGQVELRQGDVASLPYTNESFHAVLAINSIYFWLQPLEALKEIHRVLKPGGRIAITVRRKQQGIYTAYTSEKLMDLLTEAGFHQVRFENGPYPGHPILCALGIK